MRGVSLAWAVALFGCGAALAESGTVNLHLEPAVAAFIAPPQSALFGVGEELALRADLPVAGPLAVQLGASWVDVPPEPGGFDRPGRAFAVGLGLRLRALDDPAGYLAHLGDAEGHRGNLFGNLWLDAQANLVVTGPLLRFGLEVGAGLELSVVDEVQLGPFVRYAQVFQPSLDGYDSNPAHLFVAGLSVSIGLPGTAVHSPP